ncbi:MAG: hypothetical protein IJG16_11125 [Clostridia bacterium]|nr:hypothetical protein [Clostridia bacterium]
MKKLLILTALLCCIGGTATQAEEHDVGDIIGEVYPTDIVTDVCDYKIPAYNIGGETAVRVADLAGYGFDVRFEDGIAYADYNWEKEKNPIDTAAKSNINVLYTDIVVKLNGIEVPSFNIDGSMAIPIERTCETYLETNKENEISPFSLNYIWNAADKELSLDISDDRVSYQDFMIDLIKAAHMDFNSAFYNHYVKTEDGYPNEKYTEKFSDIHGTKLEEYVYLLMKADLLEYYLYEDGTKLYPYRGVTNTDAAFLVSRILGSGIEAESFFDTTTADYMNVVFDIKDENTNYTKGSLAVDDWYKVAEWAKPYFIYAVNTAHVLDIDANGNINPNAFLNKSSENIIIGKAIAYMEQGLKEEESTLTSERGNTSYTPLFNGQYSIKCMAQIVDNTLYLPLSILSELPDGTEIHSIQKIKDNELTDFQREYYFSRGGSFFVTTKQYPYQYTEITAGANFSVYPSPYSGSPALALCNKPYRLLYGEPMFPVYDYSTNECIDCLGADNIIYDEANKTLNVTYVYFGMSS